MSKVLKGGITLEPHVDEAISLISEVTALGKNISISYSGGKDSTALLFLVGLMIKRGELNPCQVSVLHSDTTIEFPILAKNTLKTLDYVKKEWGVNVDIVTAPPEKRFFASIIGYGRPIPNYAMRWCTDNLKLKPQQTLRKLYADSYVLTGEHYGESNNRDKKLSSCGSNECGVSEISKSTKKEKLIRPIINWTDCKVWDFIFYADYLGVSYEGAFAELSNIYEIANNDYLGGSLRTGCIGCPVINTSKHFNTESKGIPSYLSLKIRLLLEEMKTDDIRLLNPKIMGKKPNGHLGLGAIALEARVYYWEIIKDIAKEFSEYGIEIISKEERNYIESSLENRRYPITYKEDVIQVLEKEWKNRKPKWIATPHNNQPKVLWWSHFSGGGGSTLGAIAAGITPVLGIEWDKAIARMYTKSCGAVISKPIENVSCSEVKEFVPLPNQRRKTGEILIVQTSPPCQEFSVANKNKNLESDRANILNKTWKFYAIFLPEYVILENVRGYKQAKPYLRFKTYLEKLGYILDFEEIFNSADFGVPQSRKRLIAVWRRPEMPSTRLKNESNLNNWMGWYEAIEDLLPGLKDVKLTEFQKQVLSTSAAAPVLIERVGYRKEPKARAKDCPCWTLRASLADDGKGGTRTDVINVVLANATVKALDTKCLARLQGFPDSYEFSGKMALDVKVIGNSVTPPLMTKICESILDAVKTTEYNLVQG